MEVIYFFAAGSALYFGVRVYLLYRRYKQKNYEQSQPGFAEKYALAEEVIAAVKEVRSEVPTGILDLVKEAYENADYYEQRRSEIMEKVDEEFFVYGYKSFTGYRNMVEFALRHLPDDDMPQHTKQGGRDVTWSEDTLMYFARWASLKDYVVLQIIDYIKTNTWGRFATDEGQNRSANISAKLTDFRATAGESRKNLRREQDAILADRDLTEEDKGQQIRDLENLAESELRKLRLDLGIPDSSRGEQNFQKRLMGQVKMLSTKEEAKASLRKAMVENPDRSESIEELIDDIDSGDWEDWGS